MRLSQSFSSNQYSSDADRRNDDYRFRIETTLELDSDEHVFDITTHEHHGDGTPMETFNGTLTLADWSALQDVAELLQRYVRAQDDRTRSITIPLESGTGYNTNPGRHVDELEEATFTVDDHELEVYANGLRGRLPHYTCSVDFTQQDRRNAIDFLDLVDELFREPDAEPILHLDHPDLRSDAVPEYVDGHYQSSVRTAFRVLEERIRAAGGFPQELVGMDLAQQAFSPDGGPLAVGDVAAEQRGWMYLYAGGFGALRNPPSHRNEDWIDQQRARQILHFVDLLLAALESQAGAADGYRSH